jgi:hypothetical protein
VIWLLDTNATIYAQHVGGDARGRLDETSRRGRIVTSEAQAAGLRGVKNNGRPVSHLIVPRSAGADGRIRPGVTIPTARPAFWSFA